MKRWPVFSLVLVVLASAGVSSTGLLFAQALPPSKQSRSDKDIKAIGHRKIVRSHNFYSAQQEQVMGKQWSEAFEKSTTLVHDPGISDYLERILQNLVRNSDADLPVTVQVLDTEEVNAFTLPGGHQYVSRGLLLRLESEGELASVLVRGVAHTAMHSATREMTEETLMKLATVPLIFVGEVETPRRAEDARSLAIPMTVLKLKREDELAADYFGVQYLYKAGYDAGCFISGVQRGWPENPVPGKPSSVAFSPFPPLTERVKSLRKEIADFLPARDGAQLSTAEFEAFRAHLLALKPADSEPKPPGPVLRTPQTPTNEPRTQ